MKSSSIGAVMLLIAMAQGAMGGEVCDNFLRCLGIHCGPGIHAYNCPYLVCGGHEYYPPLHVPQDVERPTAAFGQAHETRSTRLPGLSAKQSSPSVSRLRTAAAPAGPPEQLPSR